MHVNVKLYENDPPLANNLDWDYLNNATAKEALQDLNDMGVQLRLTPEFAKDREFMVSLAETIRVHEELFPGFIYRHGNVYGGRRNLDKGLGRALAYNKIFEREDPNDDLITGSQVGELPLSFISGHRVNSSPQENSVAAALPIFEVSPDMNQTVTVFTGELLNAEAHAKRQAEYSKLKNTGWFASTDWFTSGAGEGNERIAGMIYIMTHEFGHAINHSVSGNLSFEIDGWEDPDQYKRRWYAEYAANAMLDLFHDMGVVWRTSKKHEADDLAEKAEYYKKVREARTKIGEYLDYLRELAETLNGEPYDQDIALEIAERYDLHPEVIKFIEENPGLHVSTGFSAFTLATTLRSELPDWSTFTSSPFGRDKSLDIRATADRLKREGYIAEFDPIAWRNLVSEYGSKNLVEFEAETWASYMLNRNATEAAVRWGNTVHDMYTWWVQDDMDPDFGKNNPKE